MYPFGVCLKRVSGGSASLLSLLHALVRMFSFCSIFASASMVPFT